MTFDEAFPLIDQIDGHMRPEESRWLWDMAAALPAGSRILEIGVWAGRTTMTLGLANRAATVIGLDPKPKDMGEFLDCTERTGCHPTIMRGESPKDLPNEPFDMIFIDGNHHLNCVIRDILGAHKILKVGGYLCGHDYKTIGVRLAVDALVRFSPHYTADGKPMAHPVGSIWCAQKQNAEPYCEADMHSGCEWAKQSFQHAILHLAKKELARV